MAAARGGANSQKSPVKAAAFPLAEGEDPWTEEEVEEIRQELLADIARMERAIEVAEAGLADLFEEGSDGAGRDPADVGSSNFERDQEMSLAQNARDMLEQAQLAYRLFESGRVRLVRVVRPTDRQGPAPGLPAGDDVRHLQAAGGTAITVDRSTPTSPSPARLRLIAVAIAVGGLLVDLFTKNLAIARLDPQQPIALLGGLLTLHLIRNPGAAFSMGEDFTVVLAVIAVAALVFVSAWMLPRVRHLGWAVATGFLLAGIAGNLIDRLFREPSPFHGHVVDFLQLPLLRHLQRRRHLHHHRRGDGHLAVHGHPGDHGGRAGEGVHRAVGRRRWLASGWSPTVSTANASTWPRPG